MLTYHRAKATVLMGSLRVMMLGEYWKRISLSGFGNTLASAQAKAYRTVHDTRSTR
jgi:hypothetical protein